MSGSVLGEIFKISTWGESHGKAIGVTVGGCPAGIFIDENDIQIELDRRKPGSNKFGTMRNESDTVEILSGVFEGKTTGTPISMIIYNKDNRSRDYSEISEVFRPGHGDYSYQEKYGIRDYRGGGRSSGRETAARVAAGAVAKKVLSHIGIEINAYTISIGEISIDRNNFDYNEINNNQLYMPDKNAYEKAATFIEETRKQQDSLGGIIECVIKGVPVGIGEPVFDKLDANIAKAVMSIGAVKGIEFGLGFEASHVKGSYNNDEFFADSGEIEKRTNNSGGVLGGISDGSPIVFRAAFKPTPSISLTQKTVNASKENVDINIKGRHDPVIVPRAVPVVEAMAAIVLTDLLLINMTAKIDNIKKVYDR